MDLDLTVRYLDDLTAVNVTPPAKSVAAADVYREALRTAALTPADDLNAGVLDGSITAETVGQMVRDAALAQAAQQNAHLIVRDLHNTFNRAIRDGLREDTTRLTAELRTVFDPAAEKVTAAAKHFGPDTTAEEIVTAKPEVVKQWNQMHAHTATLDTVSRLYRTLISDVRRELPDRVSTLFVTGAVDLDQAEELYRQRGRWLALAHAGIGLHLNTPEEAQRLVVTAQQLEAKRLQSDHEERVKVNRFRHRFDLKAAKA